VSDDKIIIKQSSPVYGTLSIIFGFIGVFILSPLFSPLALILGLLACLQKEYAAGIIGISFGVIGILTSPILLALLHMPTITIYQYQGVSI
jgi:ABC-type phosphate transport system permease subunit